MSKEESLKEIASGKTIVYEDLSEVEEEDSLLSLVHYLELCLDFERSPTEENSLKIKTFLSNLHVIDYLPLKDKSIVAITIAKDLVDELDANGAVSIMEMDKIFKGLLKYAVNLKNDIGILGKTFVAYDYCYMYGLVDTVLKVCEKDYERLCAYLNNVINISNAYRLIQTAAVLNDTEYDKWVDTLNDLKQNLSPEMLNSLLAIDTMNNGGSEFQNALGDIALAEAMASMEGTKNKYEQIGGDIDQQSEEK